MESKKETKKETKKEKIANIIKMAEKYQLLAYNLHHTNPDDECNWWAVQETISLFVHYLNENDTKGYRNIGEGLIEMIESEPSMEEFKQKLQGLLK